MKVYENLDNFVILNQSDSFYLAKNKETHQAVIIYEYDGGYYDVVLLDDLFNIDSTKLFEEWMNAIGKMITSTRPYANKFPFDSKEGD